MPFTIEDFHDLVRILEEKPEWRADLRRLVLTDELLSLPEQVAHLRQGTEERFQELLTQVAALTVHVNELAQVQARTEERMGRLEEAMERLAEAQARTEERVGRLEEAMERLAEAQARTEERAGQLEASLTRLAEIQARMVDDLGDLQGRGLEADYRTKGPAYFSSVIRRAHVLSADELAARVEEAVDRGRLSDAQAQEIYRADLVVRGRRLEDGAEVYLVAEVSWGVGPQDVERAVRRAELFSRTGVTAIPVVAGRGVTAEAARLARSERVWQITDGHADLPEPASSLS